jgi:hypothetical protein
VKPAGSTFYPAVVGRFLMRFDESLQATAALAAGAPASHNFLPPGPATMFGGFNAVPRSASIELATPRQAGKFTAEFAFRDLPIDPRIVRALRIEWHIGTVSADDFARGVTGMTPQQRAIAALSPRTSGFPTNDTFRMMGIADVISAEHDEGKSIVTIEGRDPSGLLLDAKLAPTDLAKVDLRRPIDDVVFQILQLGGLGVSIERTAVVANAEEWGGLIPSPGYINGQGLNRVNLGAEGQVPKMNGPAAGQQGGMSYWDAITQFCTLVGAIPRFNRDVLEIRRGRDLFSQLRGPAPFKGGKARVVGPPDLPRTQTLPIRYFVYGRDVKTVKVERKFQGKVVPRVLVVSIDDTKRGAQKLLQGFWPPTGSPADELKLGNETLQIAKPGIRDAKRLTDIARDIYEEIGAGSGEIGGSMTTNFLATLGGDNADPDVLQMNPTDAIFVAVDVRELRTNAPLVSELTDANRREFEDEVKEVVRRLGSATPNGREQDDRLARLIVGSSRGMIQQTLGFFRTGNVHYSWDSAKGVTVNFDFSNYIFPKNAAREQTMPAPAAGGTAKHATKMAKVPKVIPNTAPTAEQSAQTALNRALIQRSLDENGLPYAVVVGPDGRFTITQNTEASKSVLVDEP